jgi:hypothetical protein
MLAPGLALTRALQRLERLLDDGVLTIMVASPDDPSRKKLVLPLLRERDQ